MSPPVTASRMVNESDSFASRRFRAAPWLRNIGLYCVLLAMLGCATPRYLASRSFRENALAGTLNLISPRGPEISKRTWDALRRYGLEDAYHANRQTSFDKIRETINQTPDPELIYALAELSYVEGQKSERAGNASEAMDHYGRTLTNTYDYLFSEDLRSLRNPYDPQFRAVCDLYNESLEDTLRLLCNGNQLSPGETYTVKTAGREFIVRTEMRGQWSTDEFDHYEFVSDYEIKTLRNRHTTYGLGVPLIAVRHDKAHTDAREDYYPDGLSYAVTAMMRCVAPEGEKRCGGSTTCVLEFFDPLVANQIELSQQWVPLETDLTTPLAYFLDSPQYRERDHATTGLINPNEVQDKRGLYMLEPYDPDRIPVLMVHGLWSSPMTWMDMFNDLRSFPEMRERYQFWFYLYPSGQPFWQSATQLRQDLADMRKTFDPGHRDQTMDQMVLVGHSMGGLISRMQTLDSGDDFWKIVSDQPPEKLQGPAPERNKLVSTLFFKPNQSVTRVITIGTPHRGSEFANDYTRWLARKFIKLPQMTVSSAQTLVGANPSLFKDTQLLTVANAIDSLSPESPIFPVMLRAKRAENVKYHNIVGDLKDPGFLKSRIGRGDGVVALASAKMDDVESELIVDAQHTKIHMSGKAIYEVRRILIEHLREIDANDRVASNSEQNGSQLTAAELVPVVIER